MCHTKQIGRIIYINGPKIAFHVRETGAGHPVTYGTYVKFLAHLRTLNLFWFDGVTLTCDYTTLDGIFWEFYKNQFDLSLDALLEKNNIDYSPINNDDAVDDEEVNVRRKGLAAKLTRWRKAFFNFF